MELQTRQILSGALAATLINYLPDAFMAADTDGVIEVSNDLAKTLFGCAVGQELKGREIHELFADGDLSSVLLNEASHNASSRLSGETEFKTIDGNPFRASYRCVWQPQTSEADASILIFINSETYQNTLQEKLAENTSVLHRKIKELDEFTYIVSHDLKAPMRAISNLAMWIEEDLAGAISEEGKNNLALLRNRVTRMDGLMNGISAYSKIGREVIQIEKVDVHALISEAMKTVGPDTEGFTTVIGSMPVLNTSRKMLLQVFVQLIGNAVKHNDKSQPEVTISAKPVDDGYEFVIADNGPGIPKEHHDYIFVMFRTLQARDKFESTGVGLTIARKVVEDCGGNIRVESEPGQGARFIFQWPVALQKKAFSQRINLG